MNGRSALTRAGDCGLSAKTPAPQTSRHAWLQAELYTWREHFPEPIEPPSSSLRAIHFWTAVQQIYGQRTFGPLDLCTEEIDSEKLRVRSSWFREDRFRAAMSYAPLSDCLRNRRRRLPSSRPPPGAWKGRSIRRPAGARWC